MFPEKDAKTFLFRFKIITVVFDVIGTGVDSHISGLLVATVHITEKTISFLFI